MVSFHEYKRRALLPLAGLGLAAYYLLVFVPLSRHAENLDEPLEKAWRKLALALDQTNATAIDFAHITNQLSETRQALRLLENARQKSVARLEAAAALREEMSAPFQLVEYQNERSKRIDDLARQAAQRHISLEGSVLNGLPEYTVEVQNPALLWAGLSFSRDLLETAMRCEISTLHALEVPVAFTNAPAKETAGRWAEIPIRIEFTASAQNAARLMQSLSLRAPEILAAGLPAATKEKAPLFIDKLVLRKRDPEKVDEVRVWAEVTGFVWQE